MNKDEHLTQDQIIGYSDGSLKGEEKNAVGRHLLVCAECRQRMPPPTVESFWRALMEESDENETQ